MKHLNITLRQGFGLLAGAVAAVGLLKTLTEVGSGRSLASKSSTSSPGEGSKRRISGTSSVRVRVTAREGACRLSFRPLWNTGRRVESHAEAGGLLGDAVEQLVVGVAERRHAFSLENGGDGVEVHVGGL
jgi:hypothetical protein